MNSFLTNNYINLLNIVNTPVPKIHTPPQTLEQFLYNKLETKSVKHIIRDLIDLAIDKSITESNDDK